jgi:hypothetical protein
MEKEFVPYGLALRLGSLGFDERCFRYESVKKICENQAQPGGCQLPNVHCAYPKCTIDSSVESLPIPTWQQAFRWFREKYDLYYTIGDVYGDFTKWSFTIGKKDKGIVSPFRENDVYFNTYAEAELACLGNLIEIVENNK